jgi:hypothetical protein
MGAEVKTQDNVFQVGSIRQGKSETPALFPAVGFRATDTRYTFPAFRNSEKAEVSAR